MSDESSIRKVAQNVVGRWIMQACVLLITAVGFPLAGFVGKRMLDQSDAILAKMETTRDDINRINQSIVRMEGDNKLINGRVDGLNRDFTSRLDSISAWTRRNSDEIDKVKDWFYVPKGK